MSAVEKILQFLKSRKTSVNSKDLANHFLIATSTANKALAKLESQGYAKKIKTQSGNHWIYCHQLHVAVPAKTNQSQKPAATYRRAMPIQNSYPNVRGYDD